MKKFFSDLLASGSTEAGGYSARKLSAFLAVVVNATWITLKYTTTEVLEGVLGLWLLFALLCLGLVTFGQLLELKTGRSSSTSSSTTTTDSKTVN